MFPYMSHVLPWICHVFSRFFGGEVLLGEVPTVTPKLSKAFRTIMTWADEHLESWYFSFFLVEKPWKLGQIDDLFRKTWKCRSFWKRDECSHVWRRQNHGKRWTIDEKCGCSHVFAEKQWFVTLVADGLSVVPEICCRWLVLKSIWLSIIEEMFFWDSGTVFCANNTLSFMFMIPHFGPYLDLGFFYDEDLEGSFFGVTRLHTHHGYRSKPVLLRTSDIAKWIVWGFAHAVFSENGLSQCFSFSICWDLFTSL